MRFTREADASIHRPLQELYAHNEGRAMIKNINFEKLRETDMISQLLSFLASSFFTSSTFFSGN